MGKLLRRRFGLVLALVVASVTILGAGYAVAGESPAGESSGGAASKSSSQRRSGAHHHRRGRRGPRGRTGPQGPAGQNGVAIPLIFKAQNPTFSTKVFEGSGLLINASCNPATSLTGVSEVAGSVIRATDVVSGAIVKTNSTNVNDQFTLTPGGAENNYVLTYLSGDGHGIVTSDYGIANGGMSLVNVACAAFGTIQVASG